MQNNHSPGLCIPLCHSTPPGVHAPPFSWCAHASWFLHASGLLVSARLLMPILRLRLRGVRTPPRAYSSRLLVFARLHFPSFRTPYASWCSQASWCQRVSALLACARLLVATCLRSPTIRTPLGVCMPPFCWFPLASVLLVSVDLPASTSLLMFTRLIEFARLLL